MRTVATDTFAMTNPALTAVLLWQFVKSYQKEAAVGPQLALGFIVLPIAMSGATIETFSGTNTRTGFLTWLTRHPELPLHLPRQIEATRDLTSEALRFGIVNGLFTVELDGTLTANEKAIALSSKLRTGADERVRMLRVASHLGQWTSQLPEATIFYSLGMTP